MSYMCMRCSYQPAQAGSKLIISSQIQTYVIEHIEDPAVKDLGYSDQELLFHQDLVYYESPPGIQLLHCVK